MAKWRPITPPVLGSHLAQMQSRIEQLERARTRGGGGGGAGGLGGIGGPTGSQIQAGAAGPTNANGEVTITFNPAFSALPTIVATAGGDGTDMLLCQVKTLSATQAVIVVTGIPVAAAPVKTGNQDQGHLHHWGGQNSDSTPAHTHSIASGTNQVALVTDPAGAHLHGIGTFWTDGPNQDHAHEITQVPKPTARQGVTVYWIATPRS